MRRILVQSYTSLCIYKAMITTFNSSLVFASGMAPFRSKKQKTLQHGIS
jgi:hypothetical protein